MCCGKSLYDIVTWTNKPQQQGHSHSQTEKNNHRLVISLLLLLVLITQSHIWSTKHKTALPTMHHWFSPPEYFAHRMLDLHLKYSWLESITAPFLCGFLFHVWKSHKHCLIYLAYAALTILHPDLFLERPLSFSAFIFTHSLSHTHSCEACLLFFFYLFKMTNACLLPCNAVCDKLVKKCFIIWIDVIWFDCFFIAARPLLH